MRERLRCGRFEVRHFKDAAEEFILCLAVPVIGQQFVVDDVGVRADEGEHCANVLLVVVHAGNERRACDELRVRKRLVGPLEIVADAGVIRATPFLVALGVGELVVVQHHIDVREHFLICRGYVEAQKDYAEQIHDDSGVNQYAQRIISTPGKQDGLAWKNPDGSWGGPVGEEMAKNLVEGNAAQGKPFHGYYFKVLKGQGLDAPLGKLDYMIEGAMIGGFALVAVPADYRVTGLKTFMVDYDGVVYQKDLGPDSLKIVQSMELYNPDKTWHPTSDNW
jgi:Protein of unknown function (DUF2950)